MVAIQELNQEINGIPLSNPFTSQQLQDMIVEMGPEWLTQVLPGGPHGGVRVSCGFFMGTQCDKHIGITPLIGGISHYIPPIFNYS